MDKKKINKNIDKNAGMRFVASATDTSKGKQTNKKALDEFTRMTMELKKNK